MATGRNTLVTDHITGIIAINDVTNYPNLTPLTAANVKYGINLPANIKSMLTVNNILIMLGLQEGTVKDSTLGGSQWATQTMYAYVAIKGLDTENEQKLAVTVAEELETYFYSNRRVSSLWQFTGKHPMTPNVWSHGSNHVVRTFLMELNFEKFGTEGVP